MHHKDSRHKIPPPPTFICTVHVVRHMACNLNESLVLYANYQLVQVWGLETAD
jgi:hypothetical protein